VVAVTVNKLAVQTFKIRHTATPAYLSHLTTVHVCGTLFSPMQFRCYPRWPTNYFLGQAFCCSAPNIWNVLPNIV